MTVDGELYMWGWNVYGQCGLGMHVENQLTPVLVEQLRGTQLEFATSLVGPLNEDTSTHREKSYNGGLWRKSYNSVSVTTSSQRRI